MALPGAERKKGKKKKPSRYQKLGDPSSRKELFRSTEYCKTIANGHLTFSTGEFFGEVSTTHLTNEETEPQRNDIPEVGSYA